MKKLTCLALAILLCLASIVAVAAPTPSKTTANLNRVIVTGENLPADAGFIVRIVEETETDKQAHLDACKVEKEKLAAEKELENYFGAVTDAAGKPVDLKQLVGADKLNVFEFAPLVTSGYKKNYGKVTAKLLFATPYEVGEKVGVLIGLVNTKKDGTQSVKWTAYEGVGVEADKENVEMQGCVQVELEPKTLIAIQEGVALVAIVSD